MSLVLLKVGGAAAPAASKVVLEQLAVGHQVCVVHGAGPQISAEMQRRGLPVEFVAGRRVTTAAGLAVVRESFAAVNAALCAEIPGAAGLMGDEIGLSARQVPELGLVGDPVPSAPPAVLDVLAAGGVPVVAPLAAGPLNVNADEMAAALAVGLHADRISFITDVPGLLRHGAVVATINADEAERLLDAGELEGGILPKLRAAITAARFGVLTEIGATAVTA
jgi:acetylglutamate kinase